MTTDAIVGRSSMHSALDWQSAALVCMAGEALGRKICRCLLARGLDMRIVAGNAAQAARTGSVALAPGHRIVMLDVVLRWRRVARGRNHQDRQCVIERMPWPNVLVALAGLENTNISRLMAGHADIVRKVRAKACRIHNPAFQWFNRGIFLARLTSRAV